MRMMLVSVITLGVIGSDALVRASVNNNIFECIETRMLSLDAKVSSDLRNAGRRWCLLINDTV